MRHVLRTFSCAAAIVASSAMSLAPAPRAVTMAQMAGIDKMDGQLVQLSAVARHTDTAQVFTFGEKQGLEIHSLIPNPATDSAHVAAIKSGPRVQPHARVDRRTHLDHLDIRTADRDLVHSAADFTWRADRLRQRSRIECPLQRLSRPHRWRWKGIQPPSMRVQV